MKNNTPRPLLQTAQHIPSCAELQGPLNLRVSNKWAACVRVTVRAPAGAGSCQAGALPTSHSTDVSGCEKGGLRIWESLGSMDYKRGREKSLHLPNVSVCDQQLRWGEAPWTCYSHVRIVCVFLLRLVHGRSWSTQHHCVPPCTCRCHRIRPQR